MSIFLPSASGGRSSAQNARRIVLPLVIGGVCIAFLVNRFEGLALTQVSQALAALSPIQWILATLATALSFAAVGQYDALFHRWLNTGVTSKRATRTGMAAIAVAQTIGMGIATGTLARWRALPELPLTLAFKLTNYISVSFMAALGILTALALAVTGTQGSHIDTFATLSVALVALVALVTTLRPNVLPIPIPPLRLMLRLFALAAIDTTLAAVALWVLLPSVAQPEFVTLLAAFLVALGAGLISGAPGGVGPFELCLITLLPTVPEVELVAAILAFRLVYYALPALLALAILARPTSQTTPQTIPPRGSATLLRAEASGLARLPTHGFLSQNTTRLLAAEASQTLVALGDPATGGPWTKPAIDRLNAEADQRQLWPAIYKCAPKSAATLRAQGWSVMPTCEEAWLCPISFTPDGSARRQLRRKLKQAAKSGVVVEESHLLPLAEMAQVAKAWAKRTSGERGFSMGRYDPQYLAHQRCFLAWQSGKLVAFASFHIAPDEWALDLMRSADDMPDGTMHALILKALESAAQDHIARLSLAAMPLEQPPKIIKRIASRREATGLRRFKSSFAPYIQRLYMAAPNKALLLLAGADILAQIIWPAGIETARAEPPWVSRRLSLKALRVPQE